MILLTPHVDHALELDYECYVGKAIGPSQGHESEYRLGRTFLK